MRRHGPNHLQQTEWAGLHHECFYQVCIMEKVIFIPASQGLMDNNVFHAWLTHSFSVGAVSGSRHTWHGLLVKGKQTTTFPTRRLHENEHNSSRYIFPVSRRSFQELLTVWRGIMKQNTFAPIDSESSASVLCACLCVRAAFTRRLIKPSLSCF